MGRLSTQQIAAGLRQAGFPEEVIPTMTAVTMAESGGDPRAHNPNAATGDNSYGLLQINMLGGMGPERRQSLGLSSDDQLFDPATNFRAAKQIYDQQGLGAWGAYTNGSYKKYAGSDTSPGASLPAAASAPTAGLNTGPEASPNQAFPALPKSGHAGVDAAVAAFSGGRMAGGLGDAIFGKATSTPVDRMAGQQDVSVKKPAPVAGDNTFVTGNTGASTGPHLDFRVYSKSKGGYVNNPGDFVHLVTTEDGRGVADAFQMTSPHGMRTHPTKGGQRMHHGIDYATPSGTKLKVAGNFVERKSEPGGGGNYNIYQHPTNSDLELVLMHGA